MTIVKSEATKNCKDGVWKAVICSKNVFSLSCRLWLITLRLIGRTRNGSSGNVHMTHSSFSQLVFLDRLNKSAGHQSTIQSLTRDFFHHFSYSLYLSHSLIILSPMITYFVRKVVQFPFLFAKLISLINCKCVVLRTCLDMNVRFVCW